MSWVDLNRLTFNYRSARDRAPPEVDWVGLHELVEFFRIAIACKLLKNRTGWADEGGHFGFAQARSRLHERVKHHLKIERRPTDDLEYIGGRGLLVQRLGEVSRSPSQFVEQPGILDRDDGLAAKFCTSVDLLVGKWTNFLAIHRERTDHSLVLQHRHGQEPSGPRQVRRSNDLRERVFNVGLVRRQIGNVSDSFGRYHATDGGFSERAETASTPAILRRGRAVCYASQQDAGRRHPSERYFQT